MAEAVRFFWPFGGVPLASLGISQAASPLSETARLGGVILITWLTFLAGSALAAAWERSWREAAVLAAVPVVLVVLGAVAPSGHDTGDSLTVAFVQGGGPQGTRAADTDPREVFERHLAATRQITEPVDLVVWPENVIDVNQGPFATSPELAEVAAEAARLDAPFSVGITEDAGDHFANAQVIVSPQGEITSRYDKVRRVPFGEYMPLRSVLQALGAPTDLVPRDALPGTAPAVLDLPSGERLGGDDLLGGLLRRVGPGTASPTAARSSSTRRTAPATRARCSRRSRSRRHGCGRWSRDDGRCRSRPRASRPSSPTRPTCSTGPASASRRCGSGRSRSARAAPSTAGWARSPSCSAALAVVVLGLLLARRDDRRAAAGGRP